MIYPASTFHQAAESALLRQTAAPNEAACVQRNERCQECGGTGTADGDEVCFPCQGTGRALMVDYASAGDSPLRNGQTMTELANGEREHFGDPAKQTGIYAPALPIALLSAEPVPEPIAHIQVTQEGPIETFFYGAACELPPGGYDLHMNPTDFDTIPGPLARLMREIADEACRVDIECHARFVGDGAHGPVYDTSQLEPGHIDDPEMVAADKRAIERAVHYLDLRGILHRPVAGYPSLVCFARA